jgi:hypothetical protein
VSRPGEPRAITPLPALAVCRLGWLCLPAARVCIASSSLLVGVSSRSSDQLCLPSLPAHQLAEAFETLTEPQVGPLANALRALASQDASPAVRSQALGVLVKLSAARSEHSSESLLKLLRLRASDKSQQVRACALPALCEALRPADVSTADLSLILQRGIFEQDAPAVKRACKSFVGHALRSRAESPVELLARTGMARALMDFRGQGGGGVGRALYTALFEQDLARAAFDAMKIQPPAQVRELQMHLATSDDRDSDEYY